MSGDFKINILLVDDQPAKLLSYEVILRDLGENLLIATSGREALEQLLKNEIAVVLIDVCMPELDGFELAAMIRDHPRFQKTAIIFISAIHLTDVDRLRGYEMGAVDYVPVPVIPEVLRAKVRVFSELYRKSRELERLNAELENRVAERTAELAASNYELLQSEQRRSLALAAGNMGAWDWNASTGELAWDDGQYRIFGVDRQTFSVTWENVRALLHSDDEEQLRLALDCVLQERKPSQIEFRARRPSGEIRHCIGAAAASIGPSNEVIGISGVTVDITDRKAAEEHQALLAREVDHRAKNALAVVQSIIRLTRAESTDEYIAAVEGRIKALSRAHTVLSHSRWQGADLRGLVDEELAPYRSDDGERVTVQGPRVMLQLATAQTLALALHELATNSAKYGALSSMSGRVELKWELSPDDLVLQWIEKGGPLVRAPVARGFGTRIITGSIERQLGGKTFFDWRPDGLQCHVSVPRANGLELASPHVNEVAKAAKEFGTVEKPAVSGHRVMIVEDEALVAMVLSHELTELGFTVVGTYSRLADATAAARTNDFDVAILDINLGGEMVYPVAEVLLDRSIPFVFITGYASEGIEAQYTNVPVLQKPVDLEVLQRILSPGVESVIASSRHQQDASIEDASVVLRAAIL
jgi:PAS domain S-box-containing protein